MKKVLGWIKGHLLIVICVVLILAFLPAGYILSGMWNKSIQQNAQDEFQQGQRDLRSRSTVSYAVPAVFEGEESITDSRAPNRAVTEFFKREREAREEQVARVVEDAVSFNARGREPLVSGLLPEPAGAQERRRKTVEMVRAISGEHQGDGVYPLARRLLDRINAGPPISEQDLTDSLNDFERNQRKNLEESSASGSLTPEQEDELGEQLVRQRLGAYASRASELSMYASPEVIMINNPGQMGVAPFEPDPALTGYTEQDAFAWQFNIWLIEDLLAGLDAANTGPTGERASVTDAVAKRLQAIEIRPFAWSDSAQAPPAPASHTSRAGDSTGAIYDVRNARLVVVADAERVPTLVDALGRSNFITVTSMRAERVDEWADLAEGYYYGPSPVLRLTMDVEVVYLRDWTKRYMPPAVREALGIQADEPAADPLIED